MGSDNTGGERLSWKQTFFFSFILCCCFVAFSLYTILTKIALTGGTSPIILAFFREIIAASILLPYAWIITTREQKAAQELTPPGTTKPFLPYYEDLGMFIILGAVMVYGVQVLSALALRHVTPLNYSLLAPSVPPLNLFFSLIFGFESFSRSSKTSWMKAGGIVIAMAGGITTALTATAHSAPAGSNVVLGNILLLGNKLCIGIYPLLEKRMLLRYAPVVIVGWAYVAGAVVTLLSLIPSLSDGSVSFSISGFGWIAIVYAGLISSAANYSAMAYVNKTTGPVFMMMHYPIQSFATPLLGFFILGSSVSVTDALGGTVIIVGLALCLYAKSLESRGEKGSIATISKEGNPPPSSSSSSSSSSASFSPNAIAALSSDAGDWTSVTPHLSSTQTIVLASTLSAQEIDDRALNNLPPTIPVKVVTTSGNRDDWG